VISREELLQKVASELERKKYVKKSNKDAIISREAQYPTGLPTDVLKVAIPHTG
jgi:PTS system galactitol-specific IIA component